MIGEDLEAEVRWLRERTSMILDAVTTAEIDRGNPIIVDNVEIARDALQECVFWLRTARIAAGFILAEERGGYPDLEADK